jgi:hypothetical protein
VPGRVEQATDKRTLGDAEQMGEACAALELELTELKASYEQYFLGVERVAPSQRHQAFKKQVLALKGQFVRQTAVKFRIQTLAARLTTYERLWDRSMAEIEAGTYRRDLFRAKRHLQSRAPATASAAAAAAAAAAQPADLDLSDLSDLDGHLDRVLAESGPLAAAPSAPAAPAVEPVPAALPPRAPAPPSVSPSAVLRAPAIPPVASAPRPQGPPRSSPSVVAARPVITPPFGAAPSHPAVAASPRPPQSAAPPPVSAAGGLTDQKIKAIYEAYVMAKKRCGEDTRSLTLDSVASSLKKQVPELMKQHRARSVEFKVVIKDGRAVLRALPKDT